MCDTAANVIPEGSSAGEAWEAVSAEQVPTLSSEQLAIPANAHGDALKGTLL